MKIISILLLLFLPLQAFSKEWTYEEAKKVCINGQKDLTVYVGYVDPNRVPPSTDAREMVVVPLGWINPWGEKVNTPCRYEFYYEDGKIWLREIVYYQCRY